MLKYFFLAFSIAIIFLTPCKAEQTTKINLPGNIIENYINSNQNLDLQFIQIEDGKKQYEGKIVIQKVGKIKLDYTSGISISIVIKDGVMSYYDNKRDQISYIPAEKSIASLFIKRIFSFNDPDVKLISQKQTDETISVEFEKTSMPEEGTFLLIFKIRDKSLPLTHSNIYPTELKITSQKGESTTIKFIKINHNNTYKDDYFVIKKVKGQINEKFRE
jgi:outer membrane lipoprotein-sorting protein